MSRCVTPQCTRPLARRQQATALELRAAMSLSRLWQRQGKRAEALPFLPRMASHRVFW
jgi:hypothetical protein